jgi:hypothetical protein
LPRRQPSAGAVYGLQSSPASASPMSLVLVFDVDPEEAAARDLLLGSAGRSHKGLVHPAIIAASPGVIAPQANAVVTASIARGDG